MKKMFNFMILIVVATLISGCMGTYCINTNVEKYGVSGEICYSPEKSKLEGSVVFVDKDGKEIIGVDENDMKDIITIIESGKKLWDYGKNFFGVSLIETPNARLHRILTEYRKYVNTQNKE